MTDRPSPDLPERVPPESSDLPGSSGPLAGAEPTGGPIDDPSLADRNNPRWSEPTTPQPDAGPLGEPGTHAGEPDTPGVLPTQVRGTLAEGPAGGESGRDAVDPRAESPDQAAQPLTGLEEEGRDNILLGRGDGAPNPALAEGGDHG